MDPAAPGEAGAAEAAGSGASRLDRGGAEKAGGECPPVHTGAGAVLRSQGGGGLWLYHHPQPEVPVGQLFQQRESQLQLPPDADAAGGHRQRGGP